MRNEDTMGTQAHSAPSEKAVPCIARQPILTADESVIAYELLVRDDAEETRSKTDTDEATRAKYADLQSKQAADIRAILTADQQAIFDKNLAEMKERMANRKNGSS